MNMQEWKPAQSHILKMLCIREISKEGKLENVDNREAMDLCNECLFQGLREDYKNNTYKDSNQIVKTSSIVIFVYKMYVLTVFCVCIMYCTYFRTSCLSGGPAKG